MHMLETAQEAAVLPGFAGAAFVVRQRSLDWDWQGQVVLGGVPVHRLSVRLDTDGHLVLRGEPRSTAPEPTLLAAFLEHARQLHLAILQKSSALHADIQRGIIQIGTTAVLLGPGGKQIRSADRARLIGRMFAPDVLVDLLFIESAAQFVSSTTERFRTLNRELAEARTHAADGPVAKAEQLSVEANRSIEEIRTSRNRMEIAIQVLRLRLETCSTAQQEHQIALRDLILVAEHMDTVWGTLEQNFGWVVEHIVLRVSIAERSATRSFTAAVFSVAAVTLLQNMLNQSLTLGLLQWTAYRVAVLAIAGVSMITLAYLLFLLARRMIK
jgi:hypothetical protein